MPRKTLKQRQEEQSTIGSRIMERAGGGKDPDWYANELFTELQQYGGSPTIGSLVSSAITQHILPSILSMIEDHLHISLM